MSVQLPAVERHSGWFLPCRPTPLRRAAEHQLCCATQRPHRSLVFCSPRSYNGTLMAYGQTGAGKTYSLSSIAADAIGMIPRAAAEIFSNIEQARRPAAPRLCGAVLVVCSHGQRRGVQSGVGWHAGVGQQMFQSRSQRRARLRPMVSALTACLRPS